MSPRPCLIVGALQGRPGWNDGSQVSVQTALRDSREDRQEQAADVPSGEGLPGPAAESYCCGRGPLLQPVGTRLQTRWPLYVTLFHSKAWNQSSFCPDAGSGLEVVILIWACSVDYKLLGILKRQFPKVPLLGLTATATSSVLQDCQKILCVQQPITISSSFNRTNLYYEVTMATGWHTNREEPDFEGLMSKKEPESFSWKWIRLRQTPKKHVYLHSPIKIAEK